MSKSPIIILAMVVAIIIVTAIPLEVPRYVSLIILGAGAGLLMNFWDKGGKPYMDSFDRGSLVMGIMLTGMGLALLVM